MPSVEYPNIEYVAAINLETDGDWRYSNELRDLLDSMPRDGAYGKHVKVFAGADDAWEFLSGVAKTASAGLSRWHNLDKYEKLYPDSLAALSRLLDAVAEENGGLSNMQAEVEANIAEGNDMSSMGGFSFEYDTGNWSWEAGFYIRVDGVVGELQWQYVDPRHVTV